MCILSLYCRQGSCVLVEVYTPQVLSMFIDYYRRLYF